MMKKLYLALILTSCIATPTRADALKDYPFLETFLKDNKEYENVLEVKTQRIFNLTYPACHESLKISRLEPTILLAPTERPAPRIEKEDEGRKNEGDETLEIVGNMQVEKELTATDDDIKAPAPIYGQWIERSLVHGCEKQVLINQMTVAYDSPTPRIAPLINGLTRLDPIDQPFAEQSIIDRLKKLERPCDVHPFTLDTRILGYRSKDGQSIEQDDQGYGWFEQWNVRACDTLYDANIVILPDPNTRYKYIARLNQKTGM